MFSKNPIREREPMVFSCNRCSYFWVSNHFFKCPRCNSGNIRVFPLNGIGKNQINDFFGGQHMNDSDQELQIEKEAVIHHVYHTNEDRDNNREVSINGSVYSISLSSNDAEETIDFLVDKALMILRELKEDK